MIFNRERDVCFGRAFASGHADLGFWENFVAWVERTPVATPASKVTGGPGWHIIDDQSAATPDAYIVISNHTAANVAADPNRYSEPHKILKVGYNTTEAGKMRIEAYLWWDVTGHQGYGRFASKYIKDYDSAQFVYDFRGGPEMLCISSRLGTDWDCFWIADWEGDANLVPGEHVVGTLQAGVTAGANVILQLDTGEAANFEEGYFYYLYDFGADGINFHEWVNYVEVLDVDAYNDTIEISACNQDFPAGSVIAAYAHRYGCGLDFNPYLTGAVGGWTACDYGAGVQMPYVSSYGYENEGGTQQIEQNANWDFLGDAMGTGGSLPQTPGMAPNDMGQYACQRPLLYEAYNKSGNTTDMNRAYGPMKNMWMTCANTLLQMTDGRRINNLNHVYFYYVYSHALLVPDYD